MSPTALGTRTGRSGSTALGGPEGLRAQLLQRRSRRARMIAGGLAALLVLLAVVGGWLVGFSSAFSTERVEVRGQRQLTVHQVQEAAAVPTGLPLARQDVDGIARRATTLPQVASATVVREWPHTVKVTVVERRPVLAVLRPDGYALVDRQGVAYETRSSIPKGVLQANADPDATRLLAELAVVVAALPADLRGEVNRIQATSVDNITLTLERGATVRWGDSSESVLKGQVVAALLTKRTTAIDVSAPHNPAIR